MGNEKYLVLSYNIQGYEIIHPILEKSDRARYLMITDDPYLGIDDNGGWTVLYDKTLSGDTFDKCYQIRFNPFKYCNDDEQYVLRIDGSVGINKNLDAIIDKFIERGDDMSLMMHPTRRTMEEEYKAWCGFRDYPVAQAKKIMDFWKTQEFYGVNHYKGLAQMCYQIQKRNKVNEDVNLMTYAHLRLIGGDKIERVDQTIFSMVVQKYFPNLKIMWVNQMLYQSDYFTWYPHHSNVSFKKMEEKTLKAPYFYNKYVTDILKPEDF